MAERRVLTERELEDIIKTIPASHHRLALMVHDAVLREKAKAAAAPPHVAVKMAIRQVARWLLEQAGEADTVRANHTRKLAQRLLDGDADPPWVSDKTPLAAAS